MKRRSWALAAAALTLALAPALRADDVPSHERARRRVDLLRAEAAAALASAHALPSSAPAPSGSSAPDLRELLLKKWAALPATRHERRERHRAELLREVGQRLSDPEVKAELALHATRLAELSRAQFLAETTRSGAARDKLVARVAKLSAREAERHRARMAKLVSAAPAASTPAPTPSTPAPAAAPSSKAAR